MAHYRKEHFVCDHPSCAGQEFSVFNTQLELMEHKLSVHNEREKVNVSESGSVLRVARRSLPR